MWQDTNLILDSGICIFIMYECEHAAEADYEHRQTEYSI